MCQKCKELGIPDYLYSNGRGKNNSFISERIYRRFYTEGSVESWRNNKSISASIFPVKEDSCNREMYSQTPNDVLYNTRLDGGGKHFFHYGILEFNTDVVNGFSEEIVQNGETRRFTLKVEHDPIDCMYPHCEVLVLENNVVINPEKSKPKSIKALVRDILLENIEVIKNPVMDLGLSAR